MNKFIIFGLTISTLFYSCDEDDDSSSDDGINNTRVDDSEALAQLENADFVLQLLHYADVDGNEDTALSSVDEFSALVNGFQNDVDYGTQTLFVTSGDIIIPGPRYFSSSNDRIFDITESNDPGNLDISFANFMGVTAAAVGNHELDQGPFALSSVLIPDTVEDDNDVEMETDYTGSLFPYLSTNIDFSGESSFNIGTDGSDASEMTNQVGSYTTTVINGETIGIIGATTPILESITSTGNLVVNGQGGTADLAAIIQQDVDALTETGVNKIILLAHMQQISIEKELAELLNGVDIIVAGGSNTRLGDSTDSLFTGDDSFDDVYPFQTTDAGDNPTLVVNVDGDFKYLGRLVVGFDEEGVLDLSSLSENLNGSYPSIPQMVSSVGGTPNAEVVELQTAINEIIDEKFENIVGFSSVYLDGRRSQVRTQETNLGNLSADANIWYANQFLDEDNQVEISIKNGGGIRAEIGSFVTPAGSTTGNFEAPNDNEVSQGHLEVSFLFNNDLTVLTVTAEELKDIMEHAISATEAGATPGQFPQVGGFNFTYSLTGTARTEGTFGSGSRITGLTVGDDVVVANGEIQGDISRTFNLVTLSFLAGGGDDYPLESIEATDIATLTGDPGASDFAITGSEQDALAEFFLEFHSTNAEAFDEIETEAANDTRIIQE